MPVGARWEALWDSILLGAVGRAPLPPPPRHLGSRCQNSALKLRVMINIRLGAPPVVFCQHPEGASRSRADFSLRRGQQDSRRRGGGVLETRSPHCLSPPSFPCPVGPVLLIPAMSAVLGCRNPGRVAGKVRGLRPGCWLPGRGP